MPITLLVAGPRGWLEPFEEQVVDDPRIQELRVVTGPAELAARAVESMRCCAVVDLDDVAAFRTLDRLMSIDTEATVVASVPHGERARGLEAIRRGAQDYLEASPDGHPDVAGILEALHRSIVRSNRVVHRLREHRRMTKVLEHAGEGYLVVDPSGAVLLSSASLDRIWPDGFDHLATIFDTLHPDDRERAQLLGAQAQAAPGVPAIGEVRAIDSQGYEHWFEIRINDQSRDPAIGGLITNVRDITDRVRSEEERHRTESWFRLGFENAPVGLTMATPDGRLTQVNQVLAALLGRPADMLVGRTLDEFLADGAAPIRPVTERVAAGQIRSAQIERAFTRPDGRTIWLLATTILVPAGEGIHAYLFSQFQDLTDHKASADALAHQATHDALTGLANRSLLEHRLRSAIESDDTTPTVLFVDVDNFKVINDGLGHAVGDQILRVLSERLRASIRADDTVARFGGDAFAVVLRGLPGLDAVRSRAERLQETLRAPILLDGETHFVSVSIGAARGEPGATAEEVLRDADAALHQAKAIGRERIEMFNASMRSQAEHRLRMATRMRQALDAGHFHVAYQPFLTIDAERAIGMEALLRWTDPDLGPVSPGEFIPVAEQTGLIVQLGAWALDEALRQLGRWRDEQPWGRELSLSVNLSARQLVVDGLVDSVQRSITASGVDAGALCLEITETAVMSDIESSIGLMRMMRGLGVELSIDDFGTGYSSLNYLKSLPLTTLKVDRSFIDGLGQDPHDTSIVEAVVALGHALGMRVHAEGVEHPHQLAELRRIGCDEAQGWLWAPAMSPSAFEEWMDTRRGG
jgi:diguanylate cyclase (GGDEF)-like protein/PAS domain S-box-containing protein